MPMWVFQTVLAALLTATISWVTWASVTSWKHETKIAVLTTRTDGIDKSLDEIKSGQKEINRKLDRLIERRR